jgi:hypothetical protein
MIERVNLDTPLDENNLEKFDMGLDMRHPYPYIKTRAG